MSTDTWLHWYWGKEDKVEDDIPKLGQTFRRNHVTRLLDIGCGTGRHVIYFSKRGFKVSGFDWSKAAVRRARGLLRAQRLSAELRVWDMTRIPYPYEDESFNAVLSISVIHHTSLNIISHIIDEIDRITEPGGFLYLQAPSYQYALKVKSGQLSEESGMMKQSQEIEPGTFIPIEGEEKGIPHHHFTREELFSLLRSFHVERIQTKHDYHYCVTARKK